MPGPERRLIGEHLQRRLTSCFEQPTETVLPRPLESTQRLRGAIPHGHWKTTTFVAGLRQEGIVAPFVLDGSINHHALETCVARVPAPELRPGDVVIMDNLSSHKGPRVRALIEAAGASLLYLPPY